MVATPVTQRGEHPFLVESAGGGIDAWRRAIDVVAALEPRHIVAGHRDRILDDDATRQITETLRYLDAAEELLLTEGTALAFFHAMLERFPALLNPGALWNGATARYPRTRVA